MSDRYEVVVTGIGLVTPVGNNKNDAWDSLINGKSGISVVDTFDTSSFTCHVGGLVRNDKEILDSILTPAKQRKTDRFIHLAIMAAYEAMQESGFTREFPEDRKKLGTYIGVGIGGLGIIGDSAIVLKEHGPRKISPFLLPQVIMNEAPGWLSMEWDLQGPMLSFCNACASGTDAIGMAYRAVERGDADFILAGGTESCLNGLSFAGFGNMRALSIWDGDPKGASRPFDKERSGFVMAEGAAILALERKDLALKRSANIYAEIVGYGSASDAFHITAIHPESRGGVNSVQSALRDAKVKPEDIGYINAHGTATPMNDPAETWILKKVFGDHVSPSNPNHAVISSTKSMTGHMLGATGAAEAAFSILALKNQVVPPTINLQTPDEECDLDYVPNTARDKVFNYAMSNSFGFGGGNAVLVFKKS